MRVFVYGSCVTRDAFELLPKDSPVSLATYIARSSMISATDQKTFRKINVDQIESAFRRRMVTWDIHGKELFHQLESLEYDLIVMDIIDERFNVLKRGKSHATHSSELTQSGFKVTRERRLTPNSADRLTAWEHAWNRFVENLKTNGRLQDLRINMVRWATEQSNGEPFGPSFPASLIEHNNKHLDSMYKIMSRALPEDAFWNFEEETQTADSDHKWGSSPFHYQKTYYGSLIDKMHQETNSQPRADATT